MDYNQIFERHGSDNMKTVCSICLDKMKGSAVADKNNEGTA
jgi:hypothetical protein